MFSGFCHGLTFEVRPAARLLTLRCPTQLVERTEVSLSVLGWNSHFEALFGPYSGQGLTPARVCQATREQYQIHTGEGEIRAELTGAFRYQAWSAAELPVVGDWVAVDAPGRTVRRIHAVLTRRTRLSRRAAGTRDDEQVLAANVDRLLVVMGLDHDFNLRRLERYLMLATGGGIQPVVVLNKTDICTGVDQRLRETEDVARDAPVIPISAIAGASVDTLRPLLQPGQTVVLAGSSGAGKSTILNSLVGEVLQRTSEVRAGDGRDRHTTTSGQLVPLPSGAVLIDTPGIRELQLWSGSGSLSQTFDDIAGLAAQCRFRDCRHETETGCAVRRALEQHELDEARWQSYRKLEAEARYHDRRTDLTAALAEKQKWKKIHKAARQFYKR